jgi:predicted nuclease with TOPRIM domain
MEKKEIETRADTRKNVEELRGKLKEEMRKSEELKDDIIELERKHEEVVSKLKRKHEEEYSKVFKEIEEARARVDELSVQYHNEVEKRKELESISNAHAEES